MGHRADRHSSAHHVHGSTADKSATEDECMYSAFVLQCAGDFQCFIQFHTAFKTVAHIHFNQDCHIRTGCFHNFFHAHFHETHTVFEASAIFVFPVVGVRGKELADQVTVSGMYFYGIHSGFACQVDSLSEGFRHGHDFGLFHPPDKSGRVEVESG